MARPLVTVRADGRVVCESCLVADRPMARMRGLLGRDELPRGEGILLRPAGSIHTFFMRFPIDVVFLDKERTVIGIDHNLKPWRTARRKNAKAVLELPAGEAERRELVVGERLEQESGQTQAEYALVLVVITATVIATLGLMSGAVASLIRLATQVFPS